MQTRVAILDIAKGVSEGLLIFRMIAPYQPGNIDKSFPYTPPEFYAMTPQGLYDIEQKVCISIGEYHKDQYRAALGMSGFANQLVSGLIGWQTMGSGISIIKTTAQVKGAMAENSVDYNVLKHKEIRDEINRQYAEYSAKWKVDNLPNDLLSRLGLLKITHSETETKTETTTRS